MQDSQYWKIVRENKLRTLKDLFSSNQASPNDLCVAQSGHTFLHESIITNRKEIFKLCLLYQEFNFYQNIKFKADVNRQDRNLWTPLMKACALGRTAMIPELLEKGADPYLKDSKGENSFDKAVKFERINVLNILNTHCGIQSEQDPQEIIIPEIIVDENEKL